MVTALPDSGTHSLVSPPAVDYPLARSRMLRLLVWWFWALAVAIDGYWLFVAPAGDWRPWAGATVTVCAGWLAWRSGPLTQSGVLAWDGAAWFWEHAGVQLQGRVGVRLDLQSGLLVRFFADAGSAHWFWLDRASRPGHWLALRRAVHGAAGRPEGAIRGTAKKAARP